MPGLVRNAQAGRDEGETDRDHMDRDGRRDVRALEVGSTSAPWLRLTRGI